MLERNYRQNCGVARAADLLGERWTLLIVRDLLIAPRRFSELERRMKGMGTNLLAKRLREMGAAGLLTGGGSSVYALTAMGRALEPVILALAKWSLYWQAGSADPQGLHYPDWDLLVLKALFMPERAPQGPTTALFSSGDWSGWVKLEGRALTYGLGEPEGEPDIKFPFAVAQLRDPQRALARVAKTEREGAQRFVQSFAMA